MSGSLRVGAFALALAALFGAAVGVGAAVGPLERGVRAEEAHGEPDDGAMAMEADGPAGLAVAEDGLRLELVRARPPLAFRIVRAGGATLRAFDVEHEKRMHLIVVRRDLAEFRHLHPSERDGVWAADVPLGEPGAYRAFADFSTGGAKRTLGVDLLVPGPWTPLPLPAPASRASVDGYDVELARRGGELEFAVSRGGRPVGVQPYLGARGHLVLLREGDLAYLHNHADEDALRFETTFPSAGRYRAFLQFRHGGAVRTAAFTIEVAR